MNRISQGARQNIQRPAPGFRYGTSGALVNVNCYGYSWSSTVSGIGSMRLDFGVTWLNSSGAGYRVYGFQLRCLSE